MATLRPRGKTWQLNFRQGGRQRRISLGEIPKRDAEIKLREKELELRTGRRYSSGGPTFSAFAVDYLGWYKVHFPRSYDRVAIIVDHLAPVFGPYDIETISPLDASNYVAARSRHVSPGTITKEMRCLLAMLNRAKEWRQIKEHGLEFYSAPAELASREPLYYTTDQLKRLYWASYDYEHVWRLIANTGMRRNEALFLRLADIRKDSIMIESRDDAATKSRRWREVPLNASARGAIDTLRRAATGKVYLLHRVRPPSLSRAFDHCASRVLLPGSLHTLRHTFVSHLVMAGVDLPTVQKLAGHASITTTMRYAHLAEEHKAKAVLKIAL